MGSNRNCVRRVQCILGLGCAAYHLILSHHRTKSPPNTLKTRKFSQAIQVAASQESRYFLKQFYTFTFHAIRTNMRPTPAMFQQAARSAPGILQRLAKSPMSPPVEVLPILILPVGMVSSTVYFFQIPPPNRISFTLISDFQLSFAAYTGSREFKYDRNLRLKRTNVAAMQEH